MNSYLGISLLLSTANAETGMARAIDLEILLLSVNLRLYRPTRHAVEQEDETYTLPVLIVHMALGQGPAYLLLVFLGELVPATEKAVVLFLGVTIHFLQGLHDVLDHLGGGAAPKKCQSLLYEMRDLVAALTSGATARSGSVQYRPRCQREVHPS